jgi:hypothetical protein
MAGEDLLRGTWSTGRVTQQEMDDTLREAGLQQWIQPFRALHADSPWRSFTLALDDDRWLGYWQTVGRSRELNDGPFPMRVEGDTLIYGPGNWSTTLRWTVVGSSLTLEFVETTGPGIEGIPEEAFVRAFYTTTPFERQD